VCVSHTPSIDVMQQCSMALCTLEYTVPLLNSPWSSSKNFRFRKFWRSYLGPRPEFAQDQESGLRSDRGPVVLFDFSKLRFWKSSYDFLNLYGRFCPYNPPYKPGKKSAHLREKGGVLMLFKTTPHLGAKAQYQSRINAFANAALAFGNSLKYNRGHGIVGCLQVACTSTTKFSSMRDCCCLVVVRRSARLFSSCCLLD
jgi:hypothetical protein